VYNETNKETQDYAQIMGYPHQSVHEGDVIVHFRVFTNELFDEAVTLEIVESTFF
jgi:hypothetical protein